MTNISFTIIFLAFGKKNNSGSARARTGDLRITSPHLYHRAIGEAMVRRQKSKYINIFHYIYEVCLLFKLGVHSLQFTVDTKYWVCLGIPGTPTAAAPEMKHKFKRGSKTVRPVLFETHIYLF